jgi:hypothetical protein
VGTGAGQDQSSPAIEDAAPREQFSDIRSMNVLLGSNDNDDPAGDRYSDSEALLQFVLNA